jgi:hypothetical protein
MDLGKMMPSLTTVGTHLVAFGVGYLVGTCNVCNKKI